MPLRPRRAQWDVVHEALRLDREHGLDCGGEHVAQGGDPTDDVAADEDLGRGVHGDDVPEAHGRHSANLLSAGAHMGTGSMFNMLSAVLHRAGLLAVSILKTQSWRWKNYTCHGSHSCSLYVRAAALHAWTGVEAVVVAEVVLVLHIRKLTSVPPFGDPSPRTKVCAYCKKSGAKLKCDACL